jgi:O-antigen ligase
MTRRAGRVAAWLTVAALCAAALSSFFSLSVSPIIGTGLGVLGLLAVWRTADALLLLAALGPIAGAITALTASAHDAHRLFEAAVLVLCGGAAIRAAVRARALQPTAVEWALLAFSLVAIASCIVQVPVALLRIGESVTAPALVELVTRRLFVDRTPALAAVWQTVVLVEGLALAALTARIAARPNMAVRLSHMVVVGGAAAGALNAQRLLEISLRDPSFVDGLVRALKTLRFNSQYGDLNAAGSYFAMVTILCMAQCGFRSIRERIHGGLLLPLGLALWVSGSRVAIAATLVCGAAVIAIRLPVRLLRAIRPRTVLAGTALLAVAVAVVFFMVPSARHVTLGFSVFTRVELVETALRMWAERPMTGVGISQFYVLFPHYASTELLDAFFDATGTRIRHENAHNQFVQILVELGIVGFGAFLLVLVLALRPLRRATASRPGILQPSLDPQSLVRAGAVTAVLGFLLTALAGHPLLTPMVAYPFWVVLGLAAAGSPPLPVRLMTAMPRAVALLAVLLAATLPARWADDRRHADLDGVSLGFSGWHRDPEDRRFRWAGERTALFVSSGAGLVRVPLRSPDAVPRRVEILLDGRPAAGFVVPPGVWLDATLPLPRSASAPAYRRLDLRVTVSAGPVTPAPERLLMVGRTVEVMR